MVGSINLSLSLLIMPILTHICPNVAMLHRWLTVAQRSVCLLELFSPFVILSWWVWSKNPCHLVQEHNFSPLIFCPSLTGCFLQWITVKLWAVSRPHYYGFLLAIQAQTQSDRNIKKRVVSELIVTLANSFTIHCCNWSLALSMSQCLRFFPSFYWVKIQGRNVPFPYTEHTFILCSFSPPLTYLKKETVSIYFHSWKTQFGCILRVSEFMYAFFQDIPCPDCGCCVWSCCSRTGRAWHAPERQAT